MRVGVVGAGLAGLAASCELADRGHEVTLIEKRPFAGGKTYSFVDKATGDPADNGQHVFMRCTTAYIDFLAKIGTLDLTRRQRQLRVEVYNAEGRARVLKAYRLPAPLHLLPSFAVYGHLPIAARYRIARAMLAAYRMSEDARLALGETSFERWLAEHGQNQSDIMDFWDFLLLPTLNARSSEVAASDALFVLRRGFLASAESAAIGISSVPLSELQGGPAVAYLEQHGGHFVPGQSVEHVCADGQRASVQYTDGQHDVFDWVICATGHRQALELLPKAVLQAPDFQDLSRLPTAPIVNLHAWFDRPVAPFAFAAFTGSELQWVFNRSRLERSQSHSRPEHLVISLSGAQPYMDRSRKEMEEHFVPLLRRHLPAAANAQLIRFVAIKEPEATFVPAPGVRRPGNATTIRNLMVAGAYTATGWPATMESAVRSGVAAANAVHEQCPGGQAKAP